MDRQTIESGDVFIDIEEENDRKRISVVVTSDESMDDEILAGALLEVVQKIAPDLVEMISDREEVH